MTRVNPKIAPSPEACEAEAFIRQNGGKLTAEEWEFTMRFECCGWTTSRTHGIKRAGPDGAIVGEAGSWAVYRPRVGPRHVRECIDGGTCHHDCKTGPCFRIRACVPLSGVFAGDAWPEVDYR